MPIHLLTGLPGHGKTTGMMQMLLAAAEKGDRPLFAAGIDGIQPGIATVLDDPSKWATQERFDPPRYETLPDGKIKELFWTKVNLPDGALVFIDEAWKWFGHLGNASRQQTPHHVLALAEHRHHGIDFVWTTQGPNQIYPFSRSLIEQHWHYVRKFGTKLIEVFKWGELQEDVKSQTTREKAIKETTTIPSATFAFFKSASLHTVKARIPWKVWLIPGMLILGSLLLWTAYRTLTPEPITDSPAAAGSLLPPPASAGVAGATFNPATGLEKYVGQLTPRAPGLHGSQPIFDGREAQAVPRTYCVISGPADNTRCTCYTEQVTPLNDVPVGVCYHVARWGEYDPFRAPPAPPEDRDDADDAGDLGKDEPLLVAGTGTPATNVGTAVQGQMQGRVPETLRASGK